ncbi:hypothetical protein KIPB_002259 [Kipferlia bialata]|uniref:Uncharacterized protein n=1 Tax=Kipferlia bialata TaxID=797122 RepID=A0A9K3CR67_9EUKA|nr:hypothetical protein KIPB_002259 [Kipferlia bialata]|eukprot:g2259.t1
MSDSETSEDTSEDDSWSPHNAVIVTFDDDGVVADKEWFTLDIGIQRSDMEHTVKGYSIDETHVMLMCISWHNYSLTNHYMYTLCLDSLECHRHTQVVHAEGVSQPQQERLGKKEGEGEGEGYQSVNMWKGQPTQFRLGDRLILLGNRQPRFSVKGELCMMAHCPSDDTWERLTPPPKAIMESINGYGYHSSSHLSVGVVGDTAYFIKKESDMGYRYSFDEGWSEQSLSGVGLKLERRSGFFRRNGEYALNVMVGLPQHLLLQKADWIIADPTDYYSCPWEQHLHTWDTVSEEWTEIPFVGADGVTKAECPRMSMAVPLQPNGGADCKWIVYRNNSYDQGNTQSSPALSVMEFWEKE